MKKRPETTQPVPVQSDECPPHFWDIAAADGGASNGTCRKCRAERVFSNYLETETSYERNARRRKEETQDASSQTLEQPAQQPAEQLGTPWRQHRMGRKGTQ